MQWATVSLLVLQTGQARALPRHAGLVFASAAGDRYLLKLFRDFVFHQVTEDGAPMLDWGFVAEALTKLDAGELDSDSMHVCVDLDS